MSKSSLFENKALQQVGVGFNLVTNTNSFNALFATKPLEQSEAEQIEKILTDNFQEGFIEKDQVQQDVLQLKQITAEIKAIGKQGTILMGERVHRARELLKSYKDGAFTKWLESAFGTRKTGYNVLAYYEFYNFGILQEL